jgi:hypothetical protein
MVMKRASLSCDIANHFNLELDAYLQTVDWLQGSNNREVLFIMGWVTYARAILVVQHFSHEQKRSATYKRLTFCPSSTSTSMAPPRMFSSTSNVFMVRSHLVHKSEDGGGWRTGPTMRMMHVLPECVTESRRR